MADPEKLDNQEVKDAEEQAKIAREDEIKKIAKDMIEEHENSKEPDTTLGENTDGRVKYDWKTKYPREAIKIIKREAFYICALFFIACIILFLNYVGTISSIFGIDSRRVVFTYMVYFTISGLLGGAVFGMKCLTSVVAKGLWHVERVYWRTLSPLIALGTAFIVGAMVGSGLITADNSSANSWAVAFGFFSGYFSDEAAGKMRDVAMVVFGKTKKKE